MRKLSSFRSFYTFFYTKSNFHLDDSKYRRINLVTSKLLYKIPFIYRHAAILGFASTLTYFFFAAPDSDFDSFIHYWFNIPPFYTKNLFQKKIYSKRETCFEFPLTTPYPFENEYDLTDFYSKEWFEFWREMQKLNNNIHPLDNHIYTIRKGKPKDVEEMFYLYLQLHGLKYDCITGNKILNLDLFYELGLSPVDEEYYYFCNDYIVNDGLQKNLQNYNCNGKEETLNEMLDKNLKLNNELNILQKRKFNNYYLNLLRKNKLITPHDYHSIYFLENRKFRFSGIYNNYIHYSNNH
ncbi:hypothetical protein ABK040_009468 [Willaertia magna]